MTLVNSISNLADPILRDELGYSEGEKLEELNSILKFFPTSQEFKTLSDSDLMAFDVAMKSFTPKFIFEEGGSGLTKTIDTFHNQRGGVVFSVEKEVSDALWMAEVKDDGSFDELKWLAPSIHISYEKSDINSISIQRVSRNQLISLLQECKLTDFETPELMCMDKIFRDDPLLGDDENIIIWRVEQNTDKGFLPVRMGWFKACSAFKDIRGNYLKDNFNINNCNNFHVWVDNLPEENCAIDKREESIEDLERVFKTMAYASTQYVKPQPIAKDKKTLKEVKKNGVRVPSKGGVFRIVDLPQEIKTKLIRDYKNSKGKSHNWDNGRRAHFRYFRDDCFVNMQGKWTWIPPILDKKGNLPKWGGRIKKPRKGSKRLRPTE